MPTSGTDDRPPAGARAPALLSGLPIRVRLTLIFAAAMVFVLAISGLVVFERVRSEVGARLNLDVTRQAASVLARTERSRLGLVAAVTHSSGRGHSGFAQVLDSHGRIIAATSGLHKTALLSGQTLQRALHRDFTETRNGLFARADRPVTADNSPIDYVRTMRRTLRRFSLRIDIYGGRNDPDSLQIPAMAAALKSRRRSRIMAIVPGGHSWNTWTPHVDQMPIMASRDFAKPLAGASPSCT